jgi:MFS superfamily sulfate permease-like transporter
LTGFEIFNCLMAGLFIGVVIGFFISCFLTGKKVADCKDENSILGNEIIRLQNVLNKYRSKFGFDNNIENENNDGGNE